MAVGVFGKLPARRDYVQHGVGRALMEVFDPWLQGAMAESRGALGDAWLQTYLRAPIWRFWLGARVADGTALGAIMPSVDGVGRYFPLMIAGVFDDAPAPPEIDAQDDWFAAAEALLLGALAEGATYEALVAGLEGLPAPAGAPQAPADGADIAAAFAALRRARIDDIYGDLTCWWVPSSDGGATPARAMLSRGLPSPVEYAAMIAHDTVVEPLPAFGGR